MQILKQNKGQKGRWKANWNWHATKGKEKRNIQTVLA